ncbi:MAG: FUSC family protein [Lachnospiraceae bacterium]|nr:FUSC family protein [Lachnospiraceae bacterium]
MKISGLKVGGRTLKTVVAVFLCLLTGIVRKSDTAFYAAIAAVLCVQRTSEDSFREALNREVATVIGGICGMLVLVFERNIYCVPYEVLRCLLLSVLLIPIINFSVLIKQEKGTFLMCVVFLCITVTHGSDGNPLAFGIARIIDTTVGIAIALVINQFSLCRSKEPSHMD